ncbi:LPXTG cell wall anchor domain-containing protein [Micromonospora sp. CA-263727]|uniref:LPXTG cell wall anchor domain-containing protein n=1 Tax=Micromonospora sp. CA-263727 TaxID=3239967 RepID=UPI003D90E4B7
MTGKTSSRPRGALALAGATLAVAVTTGVTVLAPAALAEPAGTPPATPTVTTPASVTTPTPSATPTSTMEPTAAPSASTPSADPPPSTPVVTPPVAGSGRASSSADPAAVTGLGEAAVRVAAAACPDPGGSVTSELARSARIGGTIRLSGTGWCHPGGGGSAIAVKINDGAFSHLPGAGPNPNLTVWQVVEANDDGSFAVDVQLPTASNSTPAFTAGSYTLRLLTGSLRAGDTVRSVQTTSFTVTAAGSGGDEPPGRPTGVPDPYDADEDLTSATRGGVTIARSGATLRVTVPGAASGDWIFLYAYSGSSPRPVGWFAVGAERTATASLAGVDIAEGTQKVAVLDREGELLGWDDITVAAGEQLPRTGPETYRAALLGGLFLLAGSVALVSTRRRLFPGSATPEREAGA